MFLHKNIVCDPTLEPSCQDGLGRGGGGGTMFYPQYPLLSGALPVVLQGLVT